MANTSWYQRCSTGPVSASLVATAIGLLFYFGPDADQDWVWITPGAIAGTLLWLVASLLFKIYIANFTDYNGSYGTVGGVIVLLLWFYVSGLAILAGAELNAEIEHASPYGKAPGQKNAAGKVMIGRRAAKAIANSLLVKTAIHGGDPNWGRLIAVAGRANVAFELSRAVVMIGPTTLFRGGKPYDEAAAEAATHLRSPEVTVSVDLGAGTASSTVWTCDLSAEYVRINAEYRT